MSMTKTTSSGLSIGLAPVISNFTSITPQEPGFTVTVFTGVIVCPNTNGEETRKNTM